MSKVHLKWKLHKHNGIILPDLILGMIFLITFGLIVASTSSLLNKLLNSNSFSLNKKNSFLSEINFVRLNMTEWAIYFICKTHN